MSQVEEDKSTDLEPGYTPAEPGDGEVEIEVPAEDEGQIIVLGDRMLVERLAEESTRRSSMIEIPEIAKQRPNEGIVTTIGGSVFGVQVGDHVFFGPYNGFDLTVHGVDTVVLREGEVLCLTRK
jgi:chaperonin GroES